MNSIIKTASSNQTADIAIPLITNYVPAVQSARRSVNYSIYRNQEKEWSTCNDCSEKKKGKRTEPDTEQELLNQPEYIADDIVNLEEEIEIHDNEDNVLYELAKLEELVTRHFTNVDENEGVNFSGIFEFDDELRKY